MTEPKYTGDPKIMPEKMRVNGHPIRGWVVERVTAAGDVLRHWLEPFKPAQVPPGCVARPLTYGDGLEHPVPSQQPANVNPRPTGAMPPAPPPPPPAPANRMVLGPNGQLTQVAKPLPEPLQELKRTCNMNRNSGQTAVPIDYVLKCLEKFQQS